MQFTPHFIFLVFHLIVFLMAELCFVIQPLYIYIIIANQFGPKFLKDLNAWILIKVGEEALYLFYMKAQEF